MAETANNPLGLLKVIPLLEVGPPRLKKRRIKVEYKITNGDITDSFDLIYKFSEDVFIPDNYDSVNLACIMGAQVALNYGLFCERIIFHGIFDRHDISFLRKAAENTAREIYVKKFLEPNPFIMGRFAELPVVKKSRYLNAELIFDTPENRPGNKRDEADTSSSGACAVLSSGGKESLLTYGLLNEMGYNTHPIFINESGRHWHTALNAYRFFNENVPETARVWTNSDRVFNSMLRHLQFVRKDFASMRSDDYPIRLWTVAVFLFGALPILRKRGIQRLMVGDEYDTTTKANYKGIPHYDGLFDQSIFFDKFVTGYFEKKSWGINVFSILRPFSELLIEKVLIERYSDLQEHQVSCHATHMEGERVKPCGRCEKCIRIVAMLTALDRDPALCGYTREGIDHCLRSLLKKKFTRKRTR